MAVLFGPVDNMTVTHYGNQQYRGLAADTKPVAAQTAVGATFEETDTRKQYYNSGTSWLLQDLVRFKQFRVFKDGATTYVTDRMGKVQQSNTDTQLAVQAQINGMGTDVYEFLWDADFFTMNNPITHPSIPGGSVKKVIHKGTAVVQQRLTSGGTTCLIPAASFPNNRYLFEATNSGSGNTNTSQVEINGIQAANNTNYLTVNVGFVKFEGGLGLNGQENWVVNNCFTNHLWRNIHLIGLIWAGHFENNCFSSGATNFVGDADVILEDGGHTGALNPTPKDNRFINNRHMHSEGTHTDCIRIKSGGYNVFENLFIDGYKYTNSVFALNNTDTLTIHNNTFKDITVLDLNPPTPDVRQAAVYIAGTNVFDNLFRNLRIAPYPETIKIVGTGAVRNDIEFDAYFGAISRVTDTGADPTNVIRPIMGNIVAGTSNSPITHTGGVSKVVDERRGSKNGGSAFPTGNGSSLAFSFAHSLFKAPTWVSVDAGSANIVNIPFWYTWDATNITVTFNTAPPAAQFTLRWKAEAYV